MERTEENTQKLIKFFKLFRKAIGPVYSKNLNLDEDSVWKEFNKSRNYDHKWKLDGPGTLKDFIQGVYPLDPIFEQREDENIDWSFLDDYPRNIQELLVRQILLDFRKKWYDTNKIIYEFTHKEKKVEINRDYIPTNFNNNIRDELYKYIHDLDDFIIILEFFLNPPYPIKRIEYNKEEEPEKKLLYEEIDRIFKLNELRKKRIDQ